jgi:CxxC motif-containing protein
MATELLHRTCIICPRGCRLEITIEDGHVVVEGNQCPKGEDYGTEEAIEPRRILTTTVQTTSDRRPRLPVRSFGEVLLANIPVLMREIDSIVVAPPVSCGDLVAANLLGTGVDLIATDDLVDEPSAHDGGQDGTAGPETNNQRG